MLKKEAFLLALSLSMWKTKFFDKFGVNGMLQDSNKGRQGKRELETLTRTRKP